MLARCRPARRHLFAVALPIQVDGSSERRTPSDRNAGRDQIRMVGAIRSERLDGFRRNPRANDHNLVFNRRFRSVPLVRTPYPGCRARLRWGDRRYAQVSDRFRRGVCWDSILSARRTGAKSGCPRHLVCRERLYAAPRRHARRQPVRVTSGRLRELEQLSALRPIRRSDLDGRRVLKLQSMVEYKCKIE